MLYKGRTQETHSPFLQDPPIQQSTPFLGHLQLGPHLQSPPAQPLHIQTQQSPVSHFVQSSPH